MLDNYGYIHTLRICNTHCFSTATVVARSRLSVTWNTHSLIRLLAVTLHVCIVQPPAEGQTSPDATQFTVVSAHSAKTDSDGWAVKSYCFVPAAPAVRYSDWGRLPQKSTPPPCNPWAPSRKSRYGILEYDKIITDDHSYFLDCVGCNRNGAKVHVVKINWEIAILAVHKWLQAPKGEGLRILGQSVAKGGGDVSKCLDVTKVLLQPIRFCAELATLLILQSGNSPAVDEWAEAAWPNGLQ